jgi:hypothetical protein
MTTLSFILKREALWIPQVSAGAAESKIMALYDQGKDQEAALHAHLAFLNFPSDEKIGVWKRAFSLEDPPTLMSPWDEMKKFCPEMRDIQSLTHVLGGFGCWVAAEGLLQWASRHTDVLVLQDKVRRSQVKTKVEAIEDIERNLGSRALDIFHVYCERKIFDPTLEKELRDTLTARTLQELQGVKKKIKHVSFEECQNSLS